MIRNVANYILANNTTFLQTELANGITIEIERESETAQIVTLRQFCEFTNKWKPRTTIELARLNYALMHVK